MECDFCEQAAVLAVESIDSEMAYLCEGHRCLAWDAGSDWFEAAAIGAELDPKSGLPVVVFA